jgi:Holliday junction resolvasome RuvABC endonuclease subunit
MKALGFNFAKNEFSFAVLEKTTNAPTLVEKNKIVLPNLETDELMEWFETQISLIIDKHNPDIISHKISITISSLAQIKSSCYPQGILNLISKKKGIKINSFSSQGINATKFGEPKKTDVYKYIDPIIGVHKPYWNKAMKDAVLVAWFNIL